MHADYLIDNLGQMFELSQPNYTVTGDSALALVNSPTVANYFLNNP